MQAKAAPYQRSSTKPVTPPAQAVGARPAEHTAGFSLAGYKSNTTNDKVSTKYNFHELLYLASGDGAQRVEYEIIFLDYKLLPSRLNVSSRCNLF